MKELPLTVPTKLEVPSGDDEAQIQESNNTPELTNQVKQQGKSLRFPEKAFNIFMDCDKNLPNIACWSANGELIIIRDKSYFEKYCIAVSFESFIRQLHMYGFKKMNDKRTGRKTQVKDLIFRHKLFKKNRPELLEKIQTLKKVKKEKATKTKKKLGCTPDNRKIKINSVSSSGTARLAENLNNRVINLEDKVVGMQRQLRDMSFKFEAVIQMIASTHTIPLTTENVTKNKNENYKRARTEMTGDHIHSPPIDRLPSPNPVSVQDDNYPDSYHLDINPPINTALVLNSNDRRNILNCDDRRNRDSSEWADDFLAVDDDRSEKAEQKYENVFDTECESSIGSSMDLSFLNSLRDDFPDHSSAKCSNKGSRSNDHKRNSSLLMFSALALAAVVGGGAGALVVSLTGDSSRSSSQNQNIGSADPDNSRIGNLTPTSLPTSN